MNNKSFIDRVPTKVRTRLEEIVKGMLKEAFRSALDRNLEGKVWRSHLNESNNTACLSPHNPDWCQAYGIVEGVALSLGIPMAGIVGEDSKYSPKQWLTDIASAYGAEYYNSVKKAIRNDDFALRCACGRNLIVTSKCSVCDNDD